MLCPNCQAEVREGAAFCGSCGATLAPTADAGVTEPLPQPTTPMPAPDAAAQAAYQAELAEYERQKAAYEQAQYAQQVADYERQKAAYEQQAYAQQSGAYQQAGYGAPVAAAPKKKTGLVVGIVIVLIVLLLGCGVGGFFAYKAWSDKNRETPDATDTDTGTDTDTDTDADTGTGNALDSYDTAEEAVIAQLEASGVGDWVYQLTEEGDGYAYYWAGPPNSEFVDEIYLEQNPDGTWSVISVSSIDTGGDTTGESSSAADEAMWVVDLHLWYVQNDMGLEAQSLTVDPFHADSASAQVSAGGLDYYSVDGYTEESDGTFWVQTTQSWYGSVEGWEYWVVPTEAGYMIADIRYME